MKLTKEQQRVVEENRGLIGKVIKDNIRNIGSIKSLTYEDLFQIGCIGLCKAAYSDKSQNTHFSTYAYILIRNEIFTALERSTRKTGLESAWDPGELPREDQKMQIDVELEQDVNSALGRAYDTAGGVTAKGIEALRLYAEGYSYKEIGVQMGIPDNYVRAYASKARKYLKQDPNFLALRSAL